MVTLLTIQHDPGGKLLKPLKRVLPLLNDLFWEKYIIVTTNTHNDYMQPSWNDAFLDPEGMAEARRDVVRYATWKDKQDDYYFYCDLDRLVHWATIHLDELQELIPQIQNKDYTVIGRKYLAFQSHPLLQLETETIMNRLVKEKVGLDMDVFAGARMFSYQVAKWISEQSAANHAAQDIEWPMIARDNGGAVGYIEVNGLSYESAALDIRHSREDEINLRMTNLKSVLEYLE